MKSRRMNKAPRFIEHNVRVLLRKCLFTLRGSVAQNASLPSNPVELVVRVTEKLERKLDEMGVPQGRGIGQRLAAFKSCPIVAQSIQSFVAVRNRMVHQGVGWKKWFSKSSFLDDYSNISSHLQSINGILKNSEFERKYLANTAGKVSRLEYAQQMIVEKPEG